MTRRERVGALCKKGLSPGAISRRLGLSMYDVKTCLLTQAGEGAIRRSDILFTIPAKLRKEFSEFARARPGEGYWDIFNAGVAAGYNREVFRLFLDLSRDRVWRGDLYEYIADIELFLHDLVRDTLQARFGPDEAGWWRQGVPEAIRKACVETREGDLDPVGDPFAYTTFIQLGDIIGRNWAAFVAVLPRDLTASKKQFWADVRKLNAIRNGVMHPAKRVEPREADFLFARSFLRSLQVSKKGIRV